MGVFGTFVGILAVLFLLGLLVVSQNSKGEVVEKNFCIANGYTYYETPSLWHYGFCYNVSDNVRISRDYKYEKDKNIIYFVE